jgi:hypothetical protein
LPLSFLDGVLVSGEKKRLHSEIDDMTKTAKTIVYWAPFRDSLSNSPAESVIGSVVVAGYEPQPVSEVIPLHRLYYMLGDLPATVAGLELRKSNESLVRF